MKFTESHEWVDVQDKIATVGITDHAQGELGEIVYVELPEIGRTILLGEEAAVLESTKAAADVYMPISGKVVEVNTALADASEMINNSPEKEGWIFKVHVSHPEELEKLMNREVYKTFVA
jgi:glycine cleavage system H protein